MIANFLLMGELYRHNPYDTEAALWNTYPWHIGADNGLEYATSLQQFAMAKTIWRIDEDPAAQGLAITGASLGDFSMFATLILLDRWSNLGSDVGNEPEPIPQEEIGPSINGVAMISATSKSALIVVDSHAEQPVDEVLIGIIGIGSMSASSIETLLIVDPQPETENQNGFIGVTAITSLSATSEQV